MRRIVVGISGATGAQLGYRMLQTLKLFPKIEVHLVISRGAKTVIAHEMEESVADFEALAGVVHDDGNLAASISSGSFKTDGMIILPCSMKTLSAISAGYTPNLLTRAADVCLKEGRKVVLVPREMPLGRIHIRNMSIAADMGCTIVPPMLTFYSDYPKTEDQIDHVIGKILMQFDLDYKKMKAWEGREASE